MSLNVSLCFSTTNNFMSKVIRWFTRSKVSHCFIVYDDTSLVLRVVLSADSNGFIIMPLERWKKENTTMAEFIPKKDVENSLRVLAKEYLDAGYDYGAAGAIGIKNRLSFLWKMFSGWLRSKLPSSKRIHCAESFVKLLKPAGYSAVEGMDEETTDQQQLLSSFLKHEDEFEMKYIDPKLK